MSRSWKHTPIATDHKAKSTKASKQCANSKVRQFCDYNDVPTKQRSFFKKIEQTYNICDWKFYLSRPMAIKAWESGKGWCYYRRRNHNLKEFLYDCWYKDFKRK